MEAAFRGSVVRSRLDRGWPFHRLVVTPDELRVRLFLDGPVRVARGEVARVELSRMFPGFNRMVTFHTAHSSLMFVPFRAKRLLATLREYGWPLPP